MCSKVYIAQGCSLSPILFSVFINGLLKEVEQAGLGVELSDGSTIGGTLFADDFVGVRQLMCKQFKLKHSLFSLSTLISLFLTETLTSFRPLAMRPII